ncbi:MAG: MaoC/PaaZ C-terminal domain-containing protein [Sphingomicrobium sp.]
MIRPPRKFEDLVVGEVRMSEPRTVSGEEMVAFARAYDPQWFHADPEAARESTFGEVVASGVFVLAVWRQLDHGMNGDIDFVCGVGFDDFRLENALRPNDTVVAHSQILELIPSRSRTDRGTAITQYRLTNQTGATVLRFKSINLVHRRVPPG